MLNVQNYTASQNIKYSKYQIPNIHKNHFSLNNTHNIAFSGITDIFAKRAPQTLDIEALPGIKKSFVQRVKNDIAYFPNEWLKKFKENGYKVVIAPSLKEGYASQKIFDPIIEYIEKNNPMGTLALTYSEGKAGKNFFVFTNKLSSPEKYLKGIVNHELSHGVVEFNKLSQDPEILSLIRHDVKKSLAENLFDTLSQDELRLVNDYFFGNKAKSAIAEIIADTYAWAKTNNGFYGSGCVYDVNNPQLMQILFPSLSQYFKMN